MGKNCETPIKMICAIFVGHTQHTSIEFKEFVGRSGKVATIFNNLNVATSDLF